MFQVLHDQEKLTPTQVQYHTQPPEKYRLCDNFEVPGAWKVIAGTIGPDKWFMAVAPRQKSQ